ncbi:MAG TPA: cbb3-type cytochrome c oxidase subunit I [Chthoniobacteraceae bacterium]|jgi:cytochrome c oxidase cbb3-type subunit 1|nr:cbb3-type cytochrome c oxidase subunit I [Chthoniobacteraceae bacterium]
MDAVERASIDASTRGPVLFFLGNAVLWLLAATVLGLVTSIQLHQPQFLADIPFLTYGRLWPAYTNIITYGWASLAGMGVAIWLMARLCRVPVRFGGVLIVGAVFWQIGLTFGIINILAGRTTGIEWLEIPGTSAALMLVGYALVGLWGMLLFGLRKESSAYISVWYLLGAFVWFPWVFATAHLTKTLPQMQGVVQNIIAAWASHSFLSVWVTAVGLAIAYYLIPKIVNRPIFSYNVAAIGFGTFILCAGLTGAVRLSGGPVPAWLVTLSISANILLLVQIVTVAVNLVATMHDRYHMVYHSPTLRFTFFGVVAFLVGSVFGLLASLRSVDRILHFTQFQNAQLHIVLYAFFSMVIFGAIYYILPRLVGCEWLSASLITMHFYGSAYGGGTLISMLAFGGIASGLSFNDPDATFAQIVQMGAVYLPGASIGWVLIALGHLIFALHFLLMLLRIGQPGGQPTLFAPLEEQTH